MSNVEIYCGYLIWKNCNLLYLRILGAKFSWNLPSDSGEKLWKSKMSVDRETYRQWTTGDKYQNESKSDKVHRYKPKCKLLKEKGVL